MRVTTRVSPVITCRSPSVIKVHHRPLPSQSSVSDRYNRHSCQKGWLHVYHCSHKFILPHRAQCLTCTADTFAQHPKGPTESNRHKGPTESNRHICEEGRQCLYPCNHIYVYLTTQSSVSDKWQVQQSGRHICDEGMHMYTYWYSILYIHMLLDVCIIMQCLMQVHTCTCRCTHPHTHSQFCMYIIWYVYQWAFVTPWEMQEWECVVGDGAGGAIERERGRMGD